MIVKQNVMEMKTTYLGLCIVMMKSYRTFPGIYRFCLGYMEVAEELFSDRFNLM